MPLNDTASASTRKRKSTGKRLRFEVFKRDAFTCQYCGAQPPDVVLVIDHIHPVADGGDNDPLNLITACEACNQGKADKALGDRIVRPDADLLYLETQQEIAEMDRFMASIKAKESRVEQLVDILTARWFVFDPGAHSEPKWLPSTIRQLLQKFDPDTIDDAIAVTAGKVYRDELGYGEKTARYLYAVARNMAAQEDE